MAGTYSKLYVQVVFSVRNRNHALHPKWRKEGFKYMSSIISEQGHKPIIVNGVSDHVHVFFGLNPSKSISDLVREMKSSSSRFINKKFKSFGRFEWQSGYGVFSYSYDSVSNVYNYILNQESHHRNVTFHEEYVDFLEKYDIDYDSKYLFDLDYDSNSTRAWG